MRERPTTQRGSSGPSPRASIGLSPGVEVGRYVILGVAGAGAFGVVYRAYDPELDRSVALKRLSEPLSATGGYHSRISGEARTLGKLRHPNIVTIYDVGEHEGHVFVAMEYIAGPNLADWCRDGSREWSEVAPLMAGAARGLRAAHEAGVVHRDFKPENVLVEAGAAYVADFGLAVADSSADAEGGTAKGGRPQGTPPYLAPELYDGREADARSDVFSFCVALWEVAFGRRPWSALDEGESLAAKRAGVPAFPRPVLPAQVARILRAGLSADPANRPDSMTAFVHALERGRGSLRWWVGAGGLALAAVAGGLAMRTHDVCDEAAASLREVWDDDAADALRSRIVSHGSHSDETWGVVEGHLDAWAEAWVAERTDSCEATHVRREQSEALLDERSRCLDRERGRLETLLELLLVADVDVLRRAPDAAAKLRANLDCSADTVQRRRSPPQGPQRRLAMTQLDRVATLETLAMYVEGLDLVRDVEARADEAADAELKLRARHRRGRLLALTGRAADALELHQAVHWEAEAGGFDALAAKAGLEVMYEYAAPLDEPQLALGWAPHVRAAVERAGDARRDRASFVDLRGVALLYAHQPEEALAAHRRALELREQTKQEGLELVATLQNLGIVYEELHRYGEAIAHQERALSILQRVVGEHHPHTARVRDNLGTALLRDQQLPSAQKHLLAAWEVRVAVLGPRHPSVAMSSTHLAHLALLQDDAELAISRFQDALDILLSASDPQARNILLCHEGLAHAYYAEGETEAAKRHAREALDGLRPSLPPEHPEIAGLEAILDETL